MHGQVQGLKFVLRKFIKVHQ